MMNDRTLFLISAIGIFVCYFYFGILQEKITRGRYGDELNEDGTVGERFTYTLALVGVQCLCNSIFAKGMLIVKPQKEDKTHYGYYASSALTYLLAMVSSNMALRWVPYPTQVVGKSAKPIPVMILGVLIGRKSYTIQRYLCVLTIVIGIILFMYKDSKTTLKADNNTAAGDDSRSFIGLGEILLLLSLSMDGLTGAIQERMRSASAPSAQHMMLAMNWWSTIISFIALLVTGEAIEFLAFATRYPTMLIDLAMLSIAGALGQLFIFIMVANFGPLACSVVTTTRKFFTVLCSVVLFGNVLVSRQWFGAILVFAGLFADMMFGKKSPATKTSSSDAQSSASSPLIGSTLKKSQITKNEANEKFIS